MVHKCDIIFLPTFVELEMLKFSNVADVVYLALRCITLQLLCATSVSKSFSCSCKGIDSDDLQR